jgi:hypothetical protein
VADVVTGDILKAVTTLRTATGEDIQNVFHWRYVGDAVNELTVNSAIKAALDGMFDNIEPAIPSDVEFVNIDITNVTQQIFYGTAFWPSQDFGGGTGDTAPEQLCALVTGTTNRSKTLGKKFLGPFVTSTLTDGVWTNGFVAALGAFMQDYIADVAIAGLGYLRPVLVHYVNNVMTYLTEIIGGHTGNEVYTQRKRRRGVGI